MALPPLADLHLTYTDFARSDADCMPLGNGALACNVGFFTPGYIEFPVAHDAAWDEHHQLLKLCKLRIQPRSGISGKDWRQTLVPEQGAVLLEGVTRAGNALRGRIWIDRFADCLHVEIDCDEPIRGNRIQWRDRDAASTKPGDKANLYLHDQPSLPDAQLPSEAGIWWYHHNTHSPFRENLAAQHLLDEAERLGISDPLLDRIFGAVIWGTDQTDYHKNEFTSWGPTHHIRLLAHIAHPSHPDAWVTELRAARDRTKKQDTGARFAEHAGWWNRKLGRHRLHVTGPAEADRINLAYHYQRYTMLAASGGNYPIKFNGSLFTGDPHASGDKLGLSIEVERFDPDYRRWGGCYWFQNTRLAYWALLGSGDSEALPEFFNFFIEKMELAQQRTRIYAAHEGIHFPETITLWGTYRTTDYGRPEQRAGMTAADPPINEFIGLHFNNTLELVYMMLCYDDQVGDEIYFREKLVPFIAEVLLWWEQQWPRDDRGLLSIAPAHAMETYWKATNPACDVAGLHACLQALTERKADRLPPELLDRWRALQSILPPLPISDDDRLLPCDPPVPEAKNFENPELYAVFPFRLHGLGAGDAEIARRSFEARRFRDRFGWQQSGTFAALVGDAEEAKADVLERIEMRHRDSWFPAMWAHNYDWAPCQDHGSNLMLTLQHMAQQRWGDRLLHKPAVPEGWRIEWVDEPMAHR